MEEGLKYIDGTMKDWLTALINSDKPNLYLLYEAKELNDGYFQINVENVYWRENSPLKKPQGYLSIKDKNENEKAIADQWLNFFNQFIRSKEYTVSGLINFIILTDLMGSFTDKTHYELTMAVIEAIPIQVSKAVIKGFITIFNKEYKFGHASNLNKCITTSDWIKLFRASQSIAHFNNPIYLLFRLFKTFPVQGNILGYLTTLSADPRSALVQYDIEFISITGTKLINFLKKNPNEVSFYCAIIVEKHRQKFSFFSKQFGRYVLKSHWSVAGNYFFQLIFNSTNKLHEEVTVIMQEEITKLLREEIYFNRSDLGILKHFSWPEDYLALGGWLQQKELTQKDEELNQHFFDFLTNELASQFGNTKTAIPEMLSTYNSYSKEKWLGDPFKINSQYIQVYLNWSLMNSDEDSWLKLKKNYTKLCQEIKVLLYTSYFGRHIGLKLANQLLILILNFPVIHSEEISGLDRLKELHEIFVKLIGMQWIYFNEQNKLIWNNKDYQPGFMDAELLFIINILKSCPSEYKSTINPLLALIEEQQMAEWPILF